MRQNSFPRWLGIILVSALFVLLAGGAWFYRAQEHQLRDRAKYELQAIARLKVDEIAAWRTERLGDAAVLSESPFFLEGTARWMADPQGENTENLLAQFRALQKNYHYSDVVLVGVDGTEQLSLSGDLSPLHEDAAQTLAATLHDRQPRLTDLHPGSGDLFPHIGAIAPLFADNEPSAEPMGAIILQSDASQFLYPLIQSWPTPSGSAETLLVRRDGDSVLFLNELRHQKGAALTLRIPVNQTDVLAVKAVLGLEGIAQGRDYRGVEVLAAIKAVPDSPWFVVAKVDKTEVFADLQLYSRLILGLLLGAVIAVGTAGGSVWERNQRMYYQALLRAEKAHQESEARYQTTLLSIGDGVIITDTEERVILLNPVAETLTGWSQEEACGKPLEEVFRIINEETRQAVENPVRRVTREGIVVGLANHTLLITRDGREIPIADSGAPIRDREGSLRGVVLVFRDQTEEWKAQKVLQESETYTRTILDNLPVGVAVNSVDPAVTFSYINDNFVRYYRTTREALSTPDTFWEAVYENPEFRETMKNRVLADVTSGDPERMHWDDVPITRSGAETTFVSAKNTPIYGTQLMLSTVWDTTGRKKAEEILRESERKLREAQAMAHLGYWRWNVKTGEVEWSEEVFKIFGLDPKEFTPRIDAILALSPWPEDHQRDQELINRAIKTHSPDSYEQKFLRPDNSIGHYYSTFQGIYDEKDELTSIIGTVLDITERKRAEEALRRYVDRLAAINRLDRVISSNFDVTLVYDNFVKELLALVTLDRTSIVLLNEAGDQWQVARQWTRHQPVLMPGEWRQVKGSAIDWLVTHRVPLLENEIGERGTWLETAAIQREGLRSRLLLPLIVQERIVGALTAASYQPAAFSEEDQHILATIADQLAIAVQNSRLYEQVQRHADELEQRVLERTAQLEAANKELEAFSHSVSHDLRAPLRAIDGFSRLVLRDYAPLLPDEGQRWLQTVRNGAQQMGRLIDDLLTFSRLNRQPVQKVTVSPALLARTVFEELSSECENRQVNISVGDLPNCQADPALLKQVFVNLLSNAIKFTRPREVAQIEVGVLFQDKKPVYFVKDNGVGFDMHYADKLFGVFQRLHRAEEFEGTGVGLAIVQRIIYRHGGRVWAESQVDQGTTFYFTVEGESVHE